MLRWIVMLAVVAACDGGRATPATEARVHTFQLDTIGSAPPITAKLAVPATWTIVPDGPEFGVPGVEGGMISLAALELRGDTAERLQSAIAMQYGDGADARRTELAGGRVWIERVEKRVVHARLFVPCARGVVMAVAMIPHAAAPELPALRQVFETLTVVD